MKPFATYHIYDTDRIPAHEIAEKVKNDLQSLCVDIEAFSGKTGKNELFIQGKLIRSLKKGLTRCCDEIVTNAINELKKGRKQLVTHKLSKSELNRIINRTRAELKNKDTVSDT